MAKEPRRKKSPAELRSEAARSREQLEAQLRTVRSELDIPRKVRRSFQRNTGWWIAGLAVVGVVIATQVARPKQVYVESKRARKSKGKLVEAGFALGLARIAMTLFKPMIVKFVTQKVRDLASREFSGRNR